MGQQSADRFLQCQIRQTRIYINNGISCNFV